MSLDPTDLQLELVDEPRTTGSLIQEALGSALLADAEPVAARSASHVLDNGICVDCRPADVEHDHELDDGQCVTCERSTASRSFDPHQPRDPHSGKWSGGGAFVHAAVKLAKGKLQLEHHGESGAVTLHDEHGGSIRLTRRDLKHGKYDRQIGVMRGRGDFRHFASQAPIDMENVGERETLRRHETREGKPFTTLHAGLHKTHVEQSNAGFDPHGLEPYQRDEHTLHLPVGGRTDSYDELFARPGTPITTAELENLPNTIEDFSLAQRQMDLGHGPVDVKLVGNEATIDPHHKNQPPIVINRGETKKVTAALEAAWFAWAQEDQPGHVPLADGERFQRVIPTKNGDITITRLDPNGDFFLESDHNDVQISPDKIDDFLQHLEFIVNADLKHLGKASPPAP